MVNFEGIIPAAGLANRLSPLPCSKEVLSILATSPNTNEDRLTVISAHLINSMRKAGIENIHMILRSGKWDIPGYYLAGSNHLVNICYHVTENLTGPPFTLDAAYPFLKHKNLLLGFPDIIIKPEDTLKKLKLTFETDEDADVLLGLFPQTEYLKWDMIAVDEKNRVTEIIIKNEAAKSMEFGWFAAAWNPVFTEFMHKYLQLYEQNIGKNCIKNELQIGSLFSRAIESGLSIKGLIFNNVSCLDTGTIEGFKQIQRFTDE